MRLIPKPTSAREVAFNILYRVEKQKAYANVQLEAAFVETDLSVCDRALTTELVYGVLRNQGWWDTIIQQYSHRNWAQISLPIKNALRLGIYQLLKLDRVSAYAAVDEAVKLTRRCGEPAAAGFVNAVLRQVSRQPPAADLALPRKPLVDYLTRRYSHPGWLVKRWLDKWGETETEALCAANNRQLPLTVRVNTLKATVDEAVAALIAQGLCSRQHPLIGEALQIKNGRGLSACTSYRQGWLEIESIASMLVVHVLDSQPGESILDACSGRGIKAGHMAQLMQNKGRILAVDNKPRKLRQLKDNCRRWGVNIVKTIAQDISRPLGMGQVCFDRILLDAPCSTLGVIARYPECRWHRQPDDIPRLAGLQGDILNQVASYLKPGGVLVYSTCSFEAEENEGVIQSFLQANTEYTVDDPSPCLPAEVQTHVQADGCLRLLPHRWGGDGFFIARLRRKKVESS
jgi:16S rRNA (cytosine967-C5)-methyltransferase